MARPPFRDRAEAGRALAERLSDHAHGEARGDALVLALPRGGVPVGAEVAWALDLALDIFVVRKLGVPGHVELAFGAIASGAVRVLNEDIVRRSRIREPEIARVTAEAFLELRRQEREYRGGRPPLDVKDRVVILVDDGAATGASMRAAVRAVRLLSPAKVVVGLPVAPPETCHELGLEADEVRCAFSPDPFVAVGYWYEDFAPVTDDLVRELLAGFAHTTREPGRGRFLT